MRELAYKIGLRLSQIGFVRGAVDEKADLSAFDHKPTVRIVLGVSMIGFSYLMCWPAISALGGISIYFKKPWIAAFGGPILYGLSHLCFLGGMALSGAKYARLFLRWLARVGVERLLSCGIDAKESTRPIGRETLEVASDANRALPPAER
ncbi:MAG TPA: hypothetical protein VG326_16915 [Tepidisphaeraceae bacterium]|nr:hypothetical protein [Tepidisphaeraceae bacterium]